MGEEVDRSTPAVAGAGRRSASGGPAALKERLGRLRWYIGGGIALVACLAACLAVWGPEMEFPAEWGKPIGTKIDEWTLWLTVEASWLFDGIKTIVTKVLVAIEDFLLWLPWPVIILAVALIAWKLSGRTIAVLSVVSLLLIGLMGRLPGGTNTLWEGSMETLALIVVSVAISLLIGVPDRHPHLAQLAGRLLRASRSWTGCRPCQASSISCRGILFFGLGNVPAVMATVIYAMPPAIRLTNLGIRQVSSDAVESARSFGTTPFQLLIKVQIPLALPTIMAGINQTTMMALAMVVVASLVGSGGLGEGRAAGAWQAGGRQQRDRGPGHRGDRDHDRPHYASSRQGATARPARQLRKRSRGAKVSHSTDSYYAERA